MAHISLVATLEAKHVGSARASVRIEAVGWPRPQSLVGSDTVWVAGNNNDHSCQNNGWASSNFIRKERLERPSLCGVFVWAKGLRCCASCPEAVVAFVESPPGGTDGRRYLYNC